MVAKDDRRTQLRVAVYGGGGPAVIALLRAQRDLGEPLQLVGDGMASALAQHVPEAAEQASWCVAVLRVRDWEGDVELADQGRGAFRRFRDVLARWPEELARWFAFSDERQRGRARSWLAAAGYRVAPACEPLRPTRPVTLVTPRNRGRRIP